MADKRIIDLTALVTQNQTDLNEISANGTGSFKETRAQQNAYWNANVQLPATSKVTGLNTALASKLDLSGGTLTGFLTLNADPITNLEAATKQYVDNSSSAVNLNTAYAATSGQNFTIGSGLNLLGGSLNIGSSTSDPSAILQLVSATQGFLPPAGNQAQRNAIASPAISLQFYNKDTTTLDSFDGTSWRNPLMTNKIIQGANMSITVNSDASVVFASTGGGGGAGTQVQGSFNNLANSTTQTNAPSGAGIPVAVNASLFNVVNQIGTSVSVLNIGGTNTAIIQSTSTGSRWCDITFDLTVMPTAVSNQVYTFYIYTNTGISQYVGALNFQSGGDSLKPISLSGKFLLNTNDYVYLRVSSSISLGAPFYAYYFDGSLSDTTIAGIPSTDALAQGSNNIYLSSNGGTTYGNISGLLTPGNFVLGNTAGGQLVDAGFSPAALTLQNAFNNGNIIQLPNPGNTFKILNDISQTMLEVTPNIVTTRFFESTLGMKLDIINSDLVSTDSVGNFQGAGSGTFAINTSGNAGTATVLQTARAINGVNFDGSAPITVTAAAGTLTGSILNSTVVTSSLTSVGTITSGTWSGSFGSVSGANLTNLTAANINAGTANISISGNAATVTTNANLTGDVTSVGNVTTLSTANSNIGTFGDATHTVTLTLDGKGRTTAASTNLITPAGIGAPTTTGTGASGAWGISITGNAATATSSTTSTNANNINTTVSSSNTSFYLPFVASSSSGYQALDINSNLNYNPLSGVLTLPNITLTAPSPSQLIGLNSGGNIAAIGAGTSTTILHGNASGLPTYSAVSLTTDVAGVLPNTNTTAASANTASAIVARDSSGNFTAGTITATLNGNALTATDATGFFTTAVTNNASFYPILVNQTANSYQTANLNSGFSINPSTGTLSATALTLSSLSLRSVLYTSASAGIIGDSSNFVYDGSGHNLYLGTNNVSTLNGHGRLNLLGTDATTNNSQAFYTTTDLYPLIQIAPYQHDNVLFNFDAYFSAGWVSSSSSSSFQFAKTSSALNLNYGVATQGAALTWTTGISLSKTGNVSIPILTSGNLVTTDGSNNLASSNTLSSTVLGNITKVTITKFTGGASGNYTPPAGCTSIYVQGWASAGGGGGVAGAAASAGAGGGGAAGGAFKSLLVAPFGGAPFAYSVGTGGAGGAAGANNGSNGASTTFGSFTAGSGLGGTASTSGVSAAIVAGGNASAGSGSPDILIPGMSGLAGLVLSSTVASGGYGGNSPGGGSGGRVALNGNGSPGAIPGGGGGGGAATNATNRAGGNGADGELVIYEYYNG